MSRWFEAPLTTLAFCWRLSRSDGVTLGFTSHDHDLILQGLGYRAAPGMVPSAIERTAGLEPDSVQLTGALTASAITPDDLISGCWDGALLRLWAVNWQAPDDNPVLLVRGQMGAVEVADGQFSVELAGAAGALEQSAAPITSPHCRAQLGDKQCRVDMAGRQIVAKVTALSGHRVTLDQELCPEVFSFGQLRWAEGPRAGLTDQIIAQDEDSLTLADAPAMPMTRPLLVELTQGCDRRFETCVARFANATCFRGEPHLPGNDLLLRYGG